MKAYGILEEQQISVWAEPSVAGNEDGEIGQHKTYQPLDLGPGVLKEESETVRPAS